MTTEGDAIRLAVLLAVVRDVSVSLNDCETIKSPAACPILPMVCDLGTAVPNIRAQSYRLIIYNVSHLHVKFS